MTVINCQDSPIGGGTWRLSTVLCQNFSPLILGHEFLSEIVTACAEDSISQHSPNPPALTFSPPPLPCCSPSLSLGVWNVNDIGVPCRTRHSVSVLTLHSVLDLSIDYCPLQKETSLIKVDTDQVYGHKNKHLEGHLIV